MAGYSTKMTVSDDIRIRPAAISDFERLFEINELSVPGVSAESASSLQTILEIGETRVAVAADDRPIGFINLVTPGTVAYESANLRWFEAWQSEQGQTVHYVDRIAVDPSARGLGLGETLYKAAFDLTASLDGLGCEVNLLPPNPGSHRFHQRLGFAEVGRGGLRPSTAPIVRWR